MLKLIASTIVACLLAAPAIAGDLPIKPGTYVDVFTACADRSNATSLDYLGGVLHASATLTTGEKLVSRDGSTYHFSVTIHENQSGTDDTHAETVVVFSKTAFAIQTPYGVGVYRWCNAGEAL